MRRQLTGPAAIAAALDAGEPVRMLLVRGRSLDPQVQQLVDRAKALDIRVHEASDRSLWRLSLSDDADETRGVLGLVGPPADAPLDEVLGAEGAVWLLVGLVYPGNTGFAIRTADVHGTWSRPLPPLRRIPLKKPMKSPTPSSKTTWRR